MSVVDQLVNDDPRIGYSEGPGARLKAAREARGLSRVKAASQLHLSQGIVAALENDEYAGLPSSVFVRGYLRNYARLLGLPEGPVLDAYTTHKPSESVYVPAADAMGIRKERRLDRVGSGARGGSRWVSVTLAALVVGAGALWWFGGSDDPAEGGDMLVSGPALELAAPASKLAAPASELAAPGAQAVPSADMPIAGPIRAAEDGGVEVAPPKPEIRVASAPPETAVSAAPEPETPRPETRAAAVAVPAPSPVPRAVGAPASAASVVFEFRESCWVDVRDSTRRRQLFGVMKKGTRRTLRGTPPYSVVLGNAPAVNITVDGEAYDIGRHSRGNVARFTLGS